MGLCYLSGMSSSIKFSQMLHRELSSLQSELSYSFKNEGFLRQALTHASSVNEKAPLFSHNERLEFFGDSALGFVITKYLFNRFPDATEGDLSKMKASLVSKPTLFRVAKKISLGSFIILGRGEDLNGGREKPSLLADTLEALIAAVYFDGDFESMQRVVLALYSEELNLLDCGLESEDYKSQLQVFCQKKFSLIPTYHLRDLSGPDHRLKFEVEVYLKEKRRGVGVGMTKKEAERQAAKEALEHLRREKI